MEDTQDKDLFDMFGLDRNDEKIGWFVATASEAGAKLYTALEEKKTSALAFNEFVKAWEYYSIMPEPTQAECEEFVKVFRMMWDEVAGEEAEYFHFLCDKILEDENGAEEQLCVVCLEILDAIAVMNGCIPEAISIFAAAMNVVKSGKARSNACVALLYILSARIWYRSLGYSCNEEEALLTEGIEHHMNTNAGDIICITELYAIHIAAAIDDIICVRSEEHRITQKDVMMLAKEGYTVLAGFDSPQVDHARQSLYNSSGVSAEMALYGERRYSMLPSSGTKRMAN